MNPISEQQSKRFDGLTVMTWTLLTITILLVGLIVAVVVGVNSHSPAREPGSDGKNPGESSQTAGESEPAESSSETDTQRDVPVVVTYPYITVPKRESYIPKDSGKTAVLPKGTLNSSEAILVDLEDLSVVAATGADTRIYPASMTKVMALIVACDYLTDLDRTVTITQDAINYAASQDASVAGFAYAGETCTVRDLLYGVAVKSGAEATYLLVQETVGSEKEFVERMNDKCRELGLTGTHFANPTGLHDSENYTTVRDMAAIFAYALDNELCKTLLSTETYVTWLGYVKEDGTPSSYRLTMYSTLFVDRIQRNNHKKELKNGLTISGGKTGYIAYTEDGTYCRNSTLVTYATGNNGKQYLAVTSGSNTSLGTVEDYERLYQNFIP